MIDIVCDDDDSHLGSKRFRRNLDAYIQRFNDVRNLYGTIILCIWLVVVVLLFLFVV